MPTLSDTERVFLVNQGVSDNALCAIERRYSLNDACYRFIPQFIQQTSEEIFKQVLYLHDDVPEFILRQTQSPEILNQLIMHGISMYELRVSVWNLDAFRRLYQHYLNFVRISQETDISFRRIYTYGKYRQMPDTLLDEAMLKKRDREVFTYLCEQFGIPKELFDSLDENKRAIVSDHYMGLYNLLTKSVMGNMRAVQLEELPNFLALESTLLRVMLIHATEIQTFQRSGISWQIFLHLDDYVRIFLLENAWQVTQCTKHGITIDSITCLNALQVKQLLDLCGERDLNNPVNLAEIKDFIDITHLENSSAVIMHQIESQRIRMSKKQMPLAGLFQLPFEVREHILQFTAGERMPENDKRRLIYKGLMKQ